MKKKIVYICSPYSVDTLLNMKKARRYSRFAVEAGTVPIAPHLLLPQFMSEETEREISICMDLLIMERCDEVWVFEEKLSKGMVAEIAVAKEKGMKIRYFTEEMEER